VQRLLGRRAGSVLKAYDRCAEPLDLADSLGMDVGI
jgi:hypothetical protein